jgi:hypothetical protein
LFDFVTFHADLGAVSGAPEAGDTDRADLLDLMGRSAALFHPGARMTLLTSEQSAVSNRQFHRFEWPVRADSLMLDRTLAQAAYLARSDWKHPVVFLDTDMLFNDSLLEVASEDFDVAITWRNKHTAPINGGLIILNNRRPERARQFLDALAEIYRSAHAASASWDGDQFALRDYFGLDAAELARAARRDCGGVKALFLPCDKYNFSPPNKAKSAAKRLAGVTLIHFKGARKWLMPKYWDAHLAPLERETQRGPVHAL